MSQSDRFISLKKAIADKTSLTAHTGHTICSFSTSSKHTYMTLEEEAE